LQGLIACRCVSVPSPALCSTTLFTSAAVSVIQQHNKSAQPLFLYLAYQVGEEWKALPVQLFAPDQLQPSSAPLAAAHCQAVHSPDQVPQRYIDPYNATILDHTRRTFAGMLSAMDEGVGNVTAALAEAGMLDNTLIIFMA
jgi:arylsulfatase A-like enzyme